VDYAGVYIGGDYGEGHFKAGKVNLKYQNTKIDKQKIYPRQESSASCLLLFYKDIIGKESYAEGKDKSKEKRKQRKCTSK
jgi:hypothetical protein